MLAGVEPTLSNVYANHWMILGQNDRKLFFWLVVGNLRAKRPLPGGMGRTRPAPGNRSSLGGQNQIKLPQLRLGRGVTPGVFTHHLAQTACKQLLAAGQQVARLHRRINL